MSATATESSLHFSGKAVSAWGGLALMQRMLSAIGFRAAAGRWSLPPPGSNRGFAPVMLIEQFLVSLWCGANRFSQLEINGPRPAPPVATASLRACSAGQSVPGTVP